MHTVTIVLPATNPDVPESFPEATKAVRQDGVSDELMMLADDNPIFRHLAYNLRAVLEAA